MAGRSVGSIEVTVDANTGKLKAQITSASREAGQAGANALSNALGDIETAEARRKIKAMIAQIERDISGLEGDVDIDASAAYRELKKLKGQLHALENDDVIVEVDATMELETAKAAAELQQWRAKHGELEIDVAVNPELERASAAFDVWLARKSDEGIDVAVDPQTVRATIAFEAWVKRMEAKEIDIPVDIHEKGGEGGGGGGGSGGFGGRMKLILAGIVALAEPAAVALQGTLAAATSVLSSAFSGLAGAGGALPPMFAALGASVATLVVGFQGMGDALGAVSEEFATATAEGRAFNMNAAEIQAAMSNLSPAAQGVVQAFADMQPQLNSLRRVVQERLFAGMGEELQALGDAAIPAVTRGLAGMATEFNAFFRELSGIGQRIDWSGMFADLQPIVHSMLQGFTNLARAVEPFLRAAAPAAQALAAAFADVTANLTNAIQAGAQSGNLTRFLMEGVNSLKEWGRLLAATTQALFTLFQAGAASGNSFVQSLTGIINKFNDWMQTVGGQQALAEFFESGKAAMSAMVPILKGLQGMFANMVTPDAIARFAELAENIGNVLPVLGSLFRIVGQTSVLNTMALALSLVADALKPIIPALDAFAGALGGGLADIVRSMAPLLNAVGQSLGTLARALTPILPSIARLGTALVSALTPAIAQNVDQIAQAFEALSPAITLAIDIITALVQVAGTLIGVWTKVNGVIVGAIKGIGGAIEWIVEKIRGFLEMITDIPLVGRALSAVGIDMEGVGTSSEDMMGSLESASDFAGGEFPSSFDAAGAAMEELPPTMAEIAEAAGMSEKALADFESAAGATVDTFAGLEAPLSTTAKAMREAGEAAREGAAAAEEMRGAFDLLVSPMVTDAAAWSSYQAAVDDLTASFEENGMSMDTTTEQGRANTAAALEGVTAIGAWGEAALAAGTDASFVQETMQNMRNELANRLAPAFGDSAEAASAWIDQLNLTPETIDVMVNTPGMLEAMKNIVDFDRDLDGIPDKVESFIDTPGLADVKTALEGYGVDLTNVPDTVITQWIAENLQPSIDQANSLKAGAQEIDGMVVAPTIGIEDQATEPLWGVLGDLGTVDAAVASPDVTAPTAATAAGQVREVGTAADEVDGKKAAVSAEVVNNMIVMLQLSAIESQMKKLDGLSASPDIKLPSYVAIMGQTAMAIALLKVLDGTKANPTITISTFASAMAQIGMVIAMMRTLDGTRANPSIAVQGVAGALLSIGLVRGAINALEGKTVSVTANVNGLSTVQALDRAIDGLQSKTVTVTTRNVTVNSTVNSMAGRLVTSPITSNLGERGYAEAVIPLQLPLNRVDPSVRHFAEMMRNGGQTVTAAAPSTGKVVNNYMTITPASADPVAVSNQIINRAAALATR